MRHHFKPHRVSLHLFYLRYDHFLAEAAMGRTVFVRLKTGKAMAVVPIPGRIKHKPLHRPKRRMERRQHKRW